MKALTTGLLAATLTGCGAPHVDLTAPPRSAPAAERMAAYAKLKPYSAAEAETGVAGGVPASVRRTSETLRLAGGAQVMRAEDLIPVLPDESEAVSSARRAESKYDTANWLTAGGIALLVAGAAVAVSPFVTASDKDESVDLTPIYIGAGVFVLSIPVFLFGGAERRRGDEARARTFELYEPELRRRLNVCEAQGAVAPCR